MTDIMKIKIYLLLMLLLPGALQAKNTVSAYISFHDRLVMQTENVCRDLFSFRKEFREKYPDAKVYPYILPKPVLEIEFDTARLDPIFQTENGDRQEFLEKYYIALKKKFPEIEISSDAKKPGIKMVISQCDSTEDISRKVGNVHIEHGGHRIGIGHLARISLSHDDAPGVPEEFQIELKIVQDNPVASDRTIKKILQGMKIIKRFSHKTVIMRYMTHE